MPVSADPGLTTGWPERAARARLRYVSGKGGTGKSTVAAPRAQSLTDVVGGAIGRVRDFLRVRSGQLDRVIGAGD